MSSSAPTGGRFGWLAWFALVRGPSMSPTLRDGDTVLVSRWVRPRSGVIALVRWPQRPARLSVKRAVGRHGDGWWVLGDNPAGSTDSRHLGAAEPVAVVLARLWPAPRWLARRPAPWRPPGSGTGSSAGPAEAGSAGGA